MNTKRIFSTLLIAAFGGAIALAGYLFFFKNSKVTTISHQPVYTRYVSSKANEISDFTFAAENSIHAVVHVKTSSTVRYQQDQIIDFLFGSPRNRSESVVSMGSGVIISTDGYIVTNNHVIDNSEGIEVILNDKRSFKAKIIGRDRATDLALLKVDATDLPIIPYGNSDVLKIGEWVLAVGNPFNLTSTVTAGIISAKGRNLDIPGNNQMHIESFLQTDAAVNPGNSGGALVNTKGELVGINSMIYSQTGNYAGYSFAIPVSIVKKVIDDLIEFGTVQRAYLGISIEDINNEFAQKNNLEKIEGVYINAVNNNSSASQAGLLKGDIIIKVGNVVVNSSSQLQEQINRFRPGDKVNLSIKRDKKLIEIVAILKNEQGTTSFVNRNASALLGAYFEDITNDDKRSLGIEHGVKVTALNSGKFLKAGIREGFIITYVNRQPVRSFDDLQRIVNTTKGGIYIEGVYPNGITSYYAFGLK